jgi:Protein of unknown function (DUF3987)
MEQLNHVPTGEVCLSELEKEELLVTSFSNDLPLSSTIISQVHLPDKLFDNLPDFLKSACNVFDTQIEKEVFLISALGVISGCLPQYRGVYDNSSVASNLYIFICAKAAAGKGAMKWAKELAKYIHNLLKEESRLAEKEYKDLLDDFEKNKRSKSPLTMERPVIPKNKMLFVPANSSSSVILKVLSDNGGSGIIFESEADTLSTTLCQDWGNFSDILRKAFHHETLSQLRVSNPQSNEVDDSSLTVVLSGTPKQVIKLIPSVENGLYSRFGFFSFDYDLEWKDVFKVHPSGSFNDAFKFFGEGLFELYLKLSNRQNQILFDFSEEQKIIFNQTFAIWQKELFDRNGDDVVATARRLGLIDFRIAMILSMLRTIGEDSIPGNIICSDIDFENAISIAHTLKTHSLTIFDSYSNGKVEINQNDFALKASKIEKAKELRDSGYTFRQIAAEVLGDVKKQSTIANWLAK